MKLECCQIKQCLPKYDLIFASSVQCVSLAISTGVILVVLTRDDSNTFGTIHAEILARWVLIFAYSGCIRTMQWTCQIYTRYSIRFVMFDIGTHVMTILFCIGVLLELMVRKDDLAAMFASDSVFMIWLLAIHVGMSSTLICYKHTCRLIINDSMASVLLYLLIPGYIMMGFKIFVIVHQPEYTLPTLYYILLNEVMVLPMRMIITISLCHQGVTLFTREHERDMDILEGVAYIELGGEGQEGPPRPLLPQNVNTISIQ
jgi:hypothetical protein